VLLIWEIDGSWTCPVESVSMIHDDFVADMFIWCVSSIVQEPLAYQIDLLLEEIQPATFVSRIPDFCKMCVFPLGGTILLMVTQPST
jgi:hypothetical protein